MEYSSANTRYRQLLFIFLLVIDMFTASNQCKVYNFMTSSIATLECDTTFETDEIGLVQWYKSDQDHTFVEGNTALISTSSRATSRYTMTFDYSLQIHDTTLDDKGIYGCIVSHARTSDQTTGEAVLEINEISHLVRYYNTRIADSLQISCSNEPLSATTTSVKWYKSYTNQLEVAKDNIIASWLHNQTEVSSRYFLASDFSLTISTIDTYDEAIYRCVATSDGMSSNFADTVVNVEAYNYPVSIMREETSSYVTIPCQYTKNTFRTASWYKSDLNYVSELNGEWIGTRNADGDERYDSTEKYEISSTSALNVKDLDEEDQGIYRCIVTPDDGTSAFISDTFLEVSGGLQEVKTILEEHIEKEEEHIKKEEENNQQNVAMGGSAIFLSTSLFLLIIFLATFAGKNINTALEILMKIRDLLIRKEWRMCFIFVAGKLNNKELKHTNVQISITGRFVENSVWFMEGSSEDKMFSAEGQTIFILKMRTTQEELKRTKVMSIGIRSTIDMSEIFGTMIVKGHRVTDKYVPDAVVEKDRTVLIAVDKSDLNKLSLGKTITALATGYASLALDIYSANIHGDVSQNNSGTWPGFQAALIIGKLRGSSPIGKAQYVNNIRISGFTKMNTSLLVHGENLATEIPLYGVGSDGTSRTEMPLYRSDGTSRAVGVVQYDPSATADVIKVNPPEDMV